MKSLLKILGGLLIGIILGVFIGGTIVVLTSDTTWTEYFAKFSRIALSEGILVFLVAIGSLILSWFILILLHETGHLMAGLLSGYKFVSFRVLNWTIMKEDGRLRIKKFGMAGTAGQCLLSPPDLPVVEVPVGLYNAGGVLVNIIILLLVLPVFFLDLNPFVAEALAIFAMTDLLMTLLNGIPMQVGGVGNDAYNLRLLKRSRLSKLGIINQLRSNALIQQGVRPKDLPDEFFPDVESFDPKNALEVSIPLMKASRLVDKMRYEEALQAFESLYCKKEEIMRLYVKEIACELAFLYMRTGDCQKAESILDKDLRKYIETYRKMMSSKERIFFAITLFLDKDKSRAKEILNDFRCRQGDFLLQGEALSDLALMEDALDSIERSRQE